MKDLNPWICVLIGLCSASMSLMRAKPKNDQSSGIWLLLVAMVMGVVFVYFVICSRLKTENYPDEAVSRDGDWDLIPQAEVARPADPRDNPLWDREVDLP